MSSPLMSLFFNGPVQNTDEHLLAANAACTLYTSCVSVSRSDGIIEMIAESLTAFDWQHRQCMKRVEFCSVRRSSSTLSDFRFKFSSMVDMPCCMSSLR